MLPGGSTCTPERRERGELLLQALHLTPLLVQQLQFPGAAASPHLTPRGRVHLPGETAQRCILCLRTCHLARLDQEGSSILDGPTDTPTGHNIESCGSQP
eukprot:scaffold1098_cov417-Prasinococcus_capsulatus_cf.AAC.9